RARSRGGRCARAWRVPLQVRCGFWRLLRSRVRPSCDLLSLERKSSAIYHSARRTGSVRVSVVSEVRAEGRYTSSRALILRDAFDTLRIAIRYATFAFIAYCGWQAVAELAGKNTGAVLELAVKAAVHLGWKDVAPWAFALVMGIWALKERRLRQVKTARLATRN